MLKARFSKWWMEKRIEAEGLPIYMDKGDAFDSPYEDNL